MKIVYLGRSSRRSKPTPALEGDVIELLSNDWNDYGFETSFPVCCRIKGKLLDLGLLRLLIEEEYTTSHRLDRLRSDGWDGIFPIPDITYISTPSDITFYEQIAGSLGIEDALEIAKQLRDASYLVRIADDVAAINMVESEGFRKSLQRERGSIKAYLDTWRIFESQSIAVLDLGFRFTNVVGRLTTLNLKFQAETRLPHDINVLIGPNGHGKSQLLHQIVEDWISPSDDNATGFVEKPNLSQVVVVSYSPFESYPVDLVGKKFQDKEAYRYFGFRTRATPSGSKKSGRIILSRGFSQRNAAQSLLRCLIDDKRYRSIRDWSRKVETLERVLKTGFEFDFAAVEVEPQKRGRSFYDNADYVKPLTLDIRTDGARKRFIPIGSDRIEELNETLLSEVLVSKSGVTFFLNGEPIELSSGQRLFAYIVINILGAIRRNSLILVDEPELFLHPTLEIQFIDMLKSILTAFNSKALLATHSVVTVREVPSDCVHVFEKNEGNIIVRNPPFQTFGGDFQRISSYVFGDKAVSKPFESWIKDQLKEFESADQLIQELGDELNEEMIVQIRAMEYN